jgi:hypothetical protein
MPFLTARRLGLSIDQTRGNGDRAGPPRGVHAADRRFPFNRNPGVLILPGAQWTGKALFPALRTALNLVGRYHRLFEGQKIVFGEGR